MRLFAAVEIPAEAITHLQAGLPDLGPEWRPADPARWHVTLAFYGEVPDRRVPDLGARLGRAAGRMRPFELGLAGAGTFPRRAGAARVLWCGLAGELARIERLAAAAAAAGRRIGVVQPERPFRPHLTLARSRPPSGADAGLPLAELAGYAGPRWTVRQLLLVRSRLGSAPSYETLGAWPFGG